SGAAGVDEVAGAVEARSGAVVAGGAVVVGDGETAVGSPAPQAEARMAVGRASACAVGFRMGTGIAPTRLGGTARRPKAVVVKMIQPCRNALTHPTSATCESFQGDEQSPRSGMRGASPAPMLRAAGLTAFALSVLCACAVGGSASPSDPELPES